MNLGFRYDFESPFWEAQGRLATFNFANAKIRYAAGAPSALLDKLTFPFERDGPNPRLQYQPVERGPRASASPGVRFGGTSNRGARRVRPSSSRARAPTPPLTPVGSALSPAPSLTTAAPPSCAKPGDRYVPMEQKPYKLDELRYTTPGSFFTNSPDYPQGLHAAVELHGRPADRQRHGV